MVFRFRDALTGRLLSRDTAETMPPEQVVRESTEREKQLRELVALANNTVDHHAWTGDVETLRSWLVAHGYRQ